MNDDESSGGLARPHGLDPAATRWRILAEAAYEAVVVMEHGEIIDCNEPACRLFGRARADLLGQLVPGDLVDASFRDEVDRRVRDRIPGVYEAAAVRPDGVAIPVEVNGRELDVDGLRLRAVTLRDLRERKASEAQLREAGERMRALLETTFDGVLVSRAGLVLEANEGFARMCGYEPHETVGMLPSAVTTPESAAVIGEMIRKRAHTPYVVTGVRKDGSTFPMQIQGQECVYRGEHVRITGFRDLSKQRAEEAERRELEQRVYQAQRIESLGMLAGGIAHDFNNLLVGILGNAELASQRLAPESEARDFVAGISAAAKRAAELTGQLLTYAGRAKPAPAPVALESVARETAELVRSSFTAGCDLRFEFPADLPRVLADRAQLGQIVLNLLTNAVSAMDGRTGRITVAARLLEVTEAGPETLPGPPSSPGSYVCLAVRDEGKGIERGAEERMFEPFFSSRGAGHGLGLATVIGIVRSHGGGVTVESELGRGTTVEVALPVCGEAEAGSGAAADRATPSRPLSLLVIDDDPMVIEVTRSILSGANHSVLTARSGPEGLRLWHERRAEIDAVVLDVSMPGMDGEEVYRRLVATDPDVSVLFCSGFQASSTIDRLVERGAVGFLGKPYVAAALERALEQLAARRR